MEFKNSYAVLENTFLNIAKMYRGNGFYNKVDKAEKMANYCSRYTKIYHGVPGFFSWLHDFIIYLIRNDERLLQLDKVCNRMSMDSIKEIENSVRIVEKIQN
jgi:hypothetical protein